ncbi:MAG: capsid protein [Circoviridae sp.]|nr:MAG: capsid protein [Circoviridae sp.]
MRFLILMARRLRRRYARRRRTSRRTFRRRRRARAAANGQRQTARFVVKSSGTDNLIINSQAPTGIADQAVPNYAGTAAIGAYQNLIKSSYFTSIAKMYDQVRVDWMKVKITPTMSVLLQGQKQALFVSAWDRNGVTNPKNVPGFAEISSYSSAFQRPINLDATVWSVTRRINAVTLAEKSLFLPTSALLAATGSTELSDTGLALTIGQTLAAQWNPQLLIGVMLSATSFSAVSNAPTRTLLAQTQTWNYFAQIEFGLTFRGLRYDVPDGPAPMVQTYSVVNPAAQPGVDATTVDGDMPPEGPVKPTQPVVPPVLTSAVLTVGSLFYRETPERQTALGYAAPFLLYNASATQLTITTTHPGYVDIYEFVTWRPDLVGGISAGIGWIRSSNQRIAAAGQNIAIRLVGSVSQSVGVEYQVRIRMGLGSDLVSYDLAFNYKTQPTGELTAPFTAARDVVVFSSFPALNEARYQPLRTVTIDATSHTVDLWVMQRDTNPVVIGQGP